MAHVAQSSAVKRVLLHPISVTLVYLWKQWAANIVIISTDSTIKMPKLTAPE